MVEQWKPVPELDGSYLVSDHGNVKSLTRFVRGANNSLYLKDGKYLKPDTMSSGHKQISLQRHGVRYRWVISALVLTVFVGPRPEGDYHACHNNGDPADNRLENLRWDTRSGNELDKRRHGTHYEVNRTHCPRQHPLEAPNLVKAKLAVGSRECLACNRTRARIKGKRWSHYSFDELSDIIYEEIIS